MINALKGALLGLANALAVTIAICTMLDSGNRRSFAYPGVAGAILVLACILAVPCGGALGWLAGRVRTNRIFVLELVALCLIPLCGVVTFSYLGQRIEATELIALVMVAAAPTVLGVLALERWTRPRFETARALGLALRQ